jgi:ElaB/YqjD/DUF883 family membrane-anchored ribosome-binding protein
VAGASTPPASEIAAPPVVNLLNHAVQGAHDTIDRVADAATPAARQLGERVAAVEDALHANTDQLRETKDQWVGGVRDTVRKNPLACLAGAIALGAVIGRLSR